MQFAECPMSYPDGPRLWMGLGEKGNLLEVTELAGPNPALQRWWGNREVRRGRKMTKPWETYLGEIGENAQGRQ